MAQLKLLISKSDFNGRIDISDRLDPSKKLNQHILHAQDFDLCRLMTDDFYYYFMSNFNDSGVIDPDAPDAVKNLYNGGDYTVNDITRINPGIKPVLVYFSGARLIRGIDAHITPNGLRDKVNEYSDQVGSGRKSFQVSEYENQALAYWSKVVSYLGSNKTLYPQYFKNECGCGVSGRSGTRPKTIAVGNL